MELKLKIGFDELLTLVKQLPANQLELLRKELNKKNESTPVSSDLKQLLLRGPVFDEQQIDAIKEARNEINQWRTK